MAYKDALERDYALEIQERVADENDPYIFMEIMDSVQEAADGCSVEPDGTCPHGYRSPSMLLGVI